MPMLDTDVERTCDLDKEIKASGFFDDEAQEMYDLVS